MKGFTKTKLAIATAGALFAGITSVSALNASYTGVEPEFAKNLLGLNTAEVSNTFSLGLNLDIADLVIGRTTGFGVRITLLDGVTWGAGAAATVGVDIDADADFNGVGEACDPAGPTPLNCAWSITTNGIGSNVATFTVSPGTTPAGLPAGEIMQFAANQLDVTSLASTLGAGLPVKADIVLFDPVTAQILLTLQQQVLYTAAEATTTTINGGDTLKRIDVGGSGGASGDDDSKTLFSPGTAPTTIGPINNPVHQDYFFAGTVEAGLVSPLKSSVGTVASLWDSLGTNPGTGTFQYASTSIDNLDVTVSGSDFSSFAQMWLEDASNPAVIAGDECNPGNLAAANLATIGADTAAMTAPIATVTGDLYNICIQVDGVTVVEAQDLNATAQIDLDPLATMSGLLVDPALAGNAITPLQFNGDVLEIHFFNDNQNTGQESRLRISNKGDTAGLVRVVGIDDAGVVSPEATLVLAAGHSAQVRSEDFVNGTGIVTGAMGLPTKGKWRLTVTAEYEGLEVTNFIRNIESGIITNFTPSKVTNN